MAIDSGSVSISTFLLFILIMMVVAIVLSSVVEIFGDLTGRWWRYGNFNYFDRRLLLDLDLQRLLSFNLCPSLPELGWRF